MQPRETGAPCPLLVRPLGPAGGPGRKTRHSRRLRDTSRRFCNCPQPAPRESPGAPEGPEYAVWPQGCLHPRRLSLFPAGCCAFASDTSHLLPRWEPSLFTVGFLGLPPAHPPVFVCAGLPERVSACMGLRARAGGREQVSGPAPGWDGSSWSSLCPITALLCRLELLSVPLGNCFLSGLYWNPPHFVYLSVDPTVWPWFPKCCGSVPFLCS